MCELRHTRTHTHTTHTRATPLSHTSQVAPPHVFEWRLEDLVGQLVAGAAALGRVVTHVLEHGEEAEARVPGQVLLPQQLLEQRLFDWLFRVAPQVVLATPLRARQRQRLGQSSLRRRSETHNDRVAALSRAFLFISAD